MLQKAIRGLPQSYGKCPISAQITRFTVCFYAAQNMLISKFNQNTPPTQTPKHTTHSNTKNTPPNQTPEHTTHSNTRTHHALKHQNTPRTQTPKHTTHSITKTHHPLKHQNTPPTQTPKHTTHSNTKTHHPLKHQKHTTQSNTRTHHPLKHQNTPPTQTQKHTTHSNTKKHHPLKHQNTPPTQTPKHTTHSNTKTHHTLKHQNTPPTAPLSTKHQVTSLYLLHFSTFYLFTNLPFPKGRAGNMWKHLGSYIFSFPVTTTVPRTALTAVTQFPLLVSKCGPLFRLQVTPSPDNNKKCKFGATGSVPADTVSRGR
jgi:hypothetical protein